MSKPFEMHPALLVLLVVFFVSLMLTLRGALIPASATIVWIVLVGTAGFFLILYALVWLARTIYTRRHASKTDTKTVEK